MHFAEFCKSKFLIRCGSNHRYFESKSLPGPIVQPVRTKSFHSIGRCEPAISQPRHWRCFGRLTKASLRN